MTQVLITNCIGIFIVQNKKIADKILFRHLEDFKNQKHIAQQEAQLLKKHSAAKKTTFFIFPQHREFLQKFFEINLEQAKKACKAAVRKEHLVMQASDAIKDIEKAINPLVKRVQEWYALYCPEAVEAVKNQEAFIRLILSKDRKEILKEQQISFSIGADIVQKDVDIIYALATKIQILQAEKISLEMYIDGALHDIAPNLSALAGPLLAAELIAKTGSLQKLAAMPSSTIQMLGAENALFRFMRGQGRCPKHGIIVNYPLLANAKAKNKGKIARRFAGALARAAKVDYFKGDPYVGYKFKEHFERDVAELLHRKEKT